jgi:DNA polymerase III alpha subunit
VEIALRIRTGYSFGTAFGHIEQVAAAEGAKWWGFMPITDRASTFGWNRWAKLAKHRNATPVHGIEIAVSSNMNAKDRDIDYWTFYSTDGTLKPLHDLLHRATAQFKWEPVLSVDQALRAENVLIVSGGGALPEVVTRAAGKENFAVALSPSLSKFAFDVNHNAGGRFVLSNDNFYLDGRSEQAYHVALGRGASSATWDQGINTEVEVSKSLVHRHGSEVVLRASKLAREWLGRASAAQMVVGHLISPEWAAGIDLGSQCNEELAQRGLAGDAAYVRRLQREIEVIREKGFDDYFHVVGDLVRWARKEMLVGPARGSSCGSLVCYLLGITTVDPIKHGLLFERFIDVNRSDLPDIDIDFSDRQRGRAFEYMEKRYGRDHVARLGTVALFRPASALHAGAAAFGIPRWRVDALAETIEPRAAGDDRALLSLSDAFTSLPGGRKLVEEHPELATVGQLEGHPRHHSQHAAGVVLTDRPVREYVAVDARTNATHCDLKDASDLGLLKIDCLGLKQLSVFEDMFEILGSPFDDLFKLPLDLPEPLKIFNDGNFTGIFQFNGQALQGITKRVKVKSFDDIVAITALARPGPLNSGMTETWIERKIAGSYDARYPVFFDILKDTHGVPVYQEQIMQMCRAVGFGWDDVTAVRKAMGKSMGLDYLRRWMPRFVDGCEQNNIGRIQAEKLWGELCEFGAYAFNKSHSVAYAVISYWCAWAKATYPLEFAAATLTHEEDAEKQIRILRELVANGATYKAVDPDLSTDKWQVHGRMLLGPLTGIIGLGPKMLSEVMSSRARPGEEIKGRTLKMLQGARTNIDSLWPIRDKAIELLKKTPHGLKTQAIPVETMLDPGYNTGWDTCVAMVVVDRLNIKDANDEAGIAKRGFAIRGKDTKSLNVFVHDDTGQMFTKVSEALFEKVGQPMIERGGAGKAIYALRGRVRNGDFRMMHIEKALYLGDKT